MRKANRSSVRDGRSLACDCILVLMAFRGHERLGFRQIVEATRFSPVRACRALKSLAKGLYVVPCVMPARDKLLPVGYRLGKRGSTYLKDQARMRCQCGGTLQEGIAGRFDFSGYAGIKSTLINAPVLRCSKCKGKTLDGRIIEICLCLVCCEIFAHPQDFDGGLFKYLRKFWGMSREGIAQAMHVAIDLVVELESNEAKGRKPHDLVVDCGSLPWSPTIEQVSQAKSKAAKQAIVCLNKIIEDVISQKFTKSAGRWKRRLRPGTRR